MDLDFQFAVLSKVSTVVSSTTMYSMWVSTASSTWDREDDDPLQVVVLLAARIEVK